MNETLKVLDSKGVEYLWSKISLQDYPNNETLISVINAIDETKADKTEIPTKISQLSNDSGFLTSYTETDPTVPDWAKASTKPVYTAKEVGADASGTASSEVSSHNSDTTAHTDIRDDISQLSLEIADKMQLTPEFANSIDECTDTNKLYVLPDGYIYGYVHSSGNQFTNVLTTAVDENDALFNSGKGYDTGYRFNSSGGTTEMVNSVYTGFIKYDKASTIRIFGLIEDSVTALAYLWTYDDTKTKLSSNSYFTLRSLVNDYGCTLTQETVGDYTAYMLTIDLSTIKDWVGVSFKSASYFRFNVIDPNTDCFWVSIGEEMIYSDVYKWTNTGHAFVPADYEDRISALETSKSNHESRIEALESIGGSAEQVIPDYWQTPLVNGVEAINTALCEAGYNKSAFLFYSDAHWNYGSQMSPTLLKYLHQHTGMSKTFFGGDIVSVEGSDYDTMAYLWDWRNQLKALPNHHSVVGNHDDGNSTNNLFPEQYVYGYLLAAEETPDIVRGESGLYYYIDSPAEKTRYLCLDTAYKGVTEAQKTFVRDALLSTPTGWHIVAISHIWHDTIYPDTDAGITDYSVGDISNNASILLAMFDNYNSRTGDYVDCGGWVEFCIGGHTHMDFDSVSSTGIPIILVETDSKHVRNPYRSTNEQYKYTADSATEASVNGIIADYTNHKIYVVRIGRGESREVEVTNYVVSYTNVLPTALDADGVSIYNGIGYKADTRWSTSGNTESTKSGVYLTGYIPTTAGDVIRLKNITMPNTSDYTCMVHVFKTLDDTSEGNINNTNLASTYQPVWDDAGNLVEFVIPSSSTWAYFRIQCGGITAASIITVNEPIE